LVVACIASTTSGCIGLLSLADPCVGLLKTLPQVYWWHVGLVASGASWYTRLELRMVLHGASDFKWCFYSYIDFPGLLGASPEMYAFIDITGLGCSGLIDSGAIVG